MNLIWNKIVFYFSVPRPTVVAKMKRQVVEVMAALLRFTGIHSEEGKATTLNELRRISVYVFFLSYGFLGTTMFSIKNGGEFYNFVIPTAYIGALTVLMTGVLCLFHNKKRIYRMLKHLDDNVFTYSDEVNIQPKYTWLFDEKNIITKFILVMCYEITGYIFVCGSPFMGYFVTGHMKPEIYPGWTPWTVNGTVTFWMTYVSQVCVVTTSLWGYYITLTYVLFIIIEFIKQYKRLVVAVSTINLRAERSLLEKLNFSNAFNESALGDITFQRANFHHSDIKKEHIVLYNRLVRENIIMCVKHHQMLKKTFNLFKPWFTVAFSIELGACMSTYALVFYCLLEVSDFERLASLIGVAFVAIANLFARCVIGEIFSSMNELIVRATFYETDWPNQIAENKKLLTIFHMQAKNPLNLFGFTIFQASLLTFSNIIRTSYTYLNLIRASLQN